MKIVFQNEHFVAVDKDSGVLTTPSRFESDDGRVVLGRELEKELSTQIYPVHRLDFEVSGITLFALNEKAHAAANVVFEKRQVQKTYQALCSKLLVPPPTFQKDLFRLVNPQIGESFIWKCMLMRGKRRAYENAHGKQSVTNAKYLAQYKGKDPDKFPDKDLFQNLNKNLECFTENVMMEKSMTADFSDESDLHIWSLQPQTGRSHQLRYELFRHGFPILGDTLYSGLAWKESAIALRAVELSFHDEIFCQNWSLPKTLQV